MLAEHAARLRAEIRRVIVVRPSVQRDRRAALRASPDLRPEPQQRHHAHQKHRRHPARRDRVIAEIRQRAEQQQKQPLVLLRGLHRRAAKLQRVNAVRKPLVIRPQGIIAVRNLAGDHRRSLPRLIEHILPRAKQFAGRHQRAFLPPASPAERVNPPQRRGKQREHAVVFAVIGAPQHDGVCGDLPHLFLSPLPVLHTRDKLRGKIALALLLDVEIPDDGEHDRAEEIHHQILHRVNQADIQIAAHPQRLL